MHCRAHRLKSSLWHRTHGPLQRWRDSTSRHFTNGYVDRNDVLVVNWCADMDSGELRTHARSSFQCWSSVRYLKSYLIQRQTALLLPLYRLISMVNEDSFCDIFARLEDIIKRSHVALRDLHIAVLLVLINQPPQFDTIRPSLNPLHCKAAYKCFPNIASKNLFTNVKIWILSISYNLVSAW